MKISDLENIIIRNTSKINMTRGKKLLDDKAFTIDVHKVDNFYNIYGDFKSENNFKKCNPHLRIDMKNKKISFTKCNCNIFEGGELENKIYMCEHLVAAAMKFVEGIKKKLALKRIEEERIDKKIIKELENIYLIHSDEKEKVFDKKEKLVLNVSIKQVKEESSNDFDVSIYIGNTHMYPILNIKNCVCSIIKDEEYCIGKGLVYDKNKYYFSESDEQFIKYIYEIILISRNNESTSFIRISSELLKNFLEKLNNKKIKFNYNYQSYTSVILNSDLPLTFTMKKVNGDYVLSTKNIIDMNYSEAIKINNDKFNFSKKLMNIESILNKYRFYYRNENFEFLGDDEEYYLFLKNGIDEIKSIGTIFTERSYIDYFKLNNGRFKDLSIKENSKGMYEFYMQFENISPYELNDVVKAYKEKKNFIKLDNNIYVDLKSKEIEKIMKIIDTLNLDIMSGKDKFYLSIDKLYYLKDKIEDDQIVFKNREKILDLIDALHRKQDNVYEIPKNLKCNLRDHQIEGYNWFKNLSDLGLGGILGDEMGLGKTIQTIAFLASEKNGTSMVVVPTSLLYNWSDEFKKFIPGLKVCIINGEKKEREKNIENYCDYDVLITTYGLIKNDIDLYENIEFKNIILDEGQNIKNYKAQITTTVKKLKANNRFILTGTPIENNLNELWSLFDFIMPGYLYTYKVFNEKFVKNESNLEELKILIKPYILRRTKKEAAGEMPEKYEKKILVNMPKEQKDVYDACVKEIQDKINSEKMNNITIFSFLTTLRQLCLDPSLVTNEYNGESGKFNEVLNIIKKDQKENKILLFSQFTKALKKLALKLDKEKIQYCYLDGSISSAARIKLVEEFNNDKNKRVFLISLKAGGTGLNLTSANMVIHFDPWWNPSIEDQATDRAHRIGQKRDVEVIKLIAKETIEEKIVLLQEDKRNLINDVLTNELNDSEVFNLVTNSELINLLK
ncbi:SNF2-related protein [Clostridium butyricum]